MCSSVQGVAAWASIGKHKQERPLGYTPYWYSSFLYWYTGYTLLVQLLSISVLTFIESGFGPGSRIHIGAIPFKIILESRSKLHIGATSFPFPGPCSRIEDQDEGEWSRSFWICFHFPDQIKSSFLTKSINHIRTRGKPCLISVIQKTNTIKKVNLSHDIFGKTLMWS